MKKKGCIWLMIAGLLAGMLAGCGQKESGEREEVSVFQEEDVYKRQQ